MISPRPEPLHPEQEIREARHRMTLERESRREWSLGIAWAGAGLGAMVGSVISFFMSPESIASDAGSRLGFFLGFLLLFAGLAAGAALLLARYSIENSRTMDHLRSVIQSNLWIQHQQLLRYQAELKSHETYWISLIGQGERFEQELAKVFRGQGFEVRMTARSGDGGVDLIVIGGGHIAVVQCKAHQKAIGTPVLQILRGAMPDHNATLAIVASLGGFTKNAFVYARANGIQLMGPTEIAQLHGQSIS